MKNACRIGAAMIAWLGAVSSVAAQEVQWKQTLDLPKGQHISRDRADILGIEFGDTYAEAKAKLAKLDSEGIQPKAPLAACKDPRMQGLRACQTAAAPKLSEEKNIFDFRMPGHSVMTASYVGVLKLTRTLPGQGKEPVREYITLYLSAPASGHQVVAMRRDIHYPDSDQPQISALLDALKAKFKAEPHIAGNTVSFQFDNGKPAARPQGRVYCSPAIDAMREFQAVRTVNQRGDCDVVMVLDIARGVSQNHARILQFQFGDPYIDSYIRSLQTRKLGATPKL